MKQLTIDDVREALLIDKHNLGESLLEQPTFVLDVGLMHSGSISKRDYLKANLKVVEAEVGEAIVKDQGKQTVAALSKMVELDGDVIEAREAFQVEADKARSWDAAIEAVRARGFALNKLVDLEVTQGAAIGGQSEPLDRRPRRERADADTQQAMSEKRKTRRRKID